MDIQYFKLPRYKDIPDVGLLLDQVTRLVNGYLESFADIRLTNSMISNYVKHSIIARPVKKLYYREQIASLVFIAISKTVLSLEDIDVFLKIQRENHTPETAYNLFCGGFEEALSTGVRPACPEFPLPNITSGVENTHTIATASDSYLLHSLLKAVADCITLKELLAARKSI